MRVGGEKNAYAKTFSISVLISLAKVSNLTAEQVCSAGCLTRVEHTMLCVCFFFSWVL